MGTTTSATTTKSFFIPFVPHEEIIGIEIPGPMPEIQEIASLSGPTSENKTDSADAIAVTLTGTIGLPTVAMDETTTSLQPMVQLGALTEELTTTLETPTSTTTTSTRNIQLITTKSTTKKTTKKSTLGIFFGRKSTKLVKTTTTTTTTSTTTLETPSTSPQVGLLDGIGEIF